MTTHPEGLTRPSEKSLERVAFEKWMIEQAKCVVGSIDPYAETLERNYWQCWQAAREDGLKRAAEIAEEGKQRNRNAAHEATDDRERMRFVGLWTGYESCAERILMEAGEKK